MVDGEERMRRVTAIRNGTVIDHIPFVCHLDIDTHTQTVTQYQTHVHGRDHASRFVVRSYMIHGSDQVLTRIHECDEAPFGD